MSLVEACGEAGEGTHAYHERVDYPQPRYLPSYPPTNPNQPTNTPCQLHTLAHVNSQHVNQLPPHLDIPINSIYLYTLNHPSKLLALSNTITLPK